MKTKLMFMALLLSLTVYNTQAQVTIGSQNSPAKGALLDLKEFDNEDGKKTSTKGVILPRVQLERLTSLAPIVSDGDSNIETLKKTHKGLQVYNPMPTPDLELSEGMYSWNGDAWVQVTTPPHLSDDATRFLGGTIIVRYNKDTSGSLAPAKQNRIIDPIGGTHPIGSLNDVGNSVGGIHDILGAGYTVSHVSAGVFDVKFDVPFETIYGVSSNIFDSYYKAGLFGTTVQEDPVEGIPGSGLSVLDKTQVSYLDNSIVRFETGDDLGVPAGRSFTFLIIGK